MIADKLDEIKDTLLKARDTPDYNMGSPAALDHLLVHVVMLIDEIKKINEDTHD